MKEEVEFLAGGIEANTHTRGSYAYNLINLKNGWEVRKGFGQLAQYDTSFSAAMQTATDNWGIRKHLGSKLIVTSFGHEQICSLFVTRCRTSLRRTGAGSHMLDIYTLDIYDITADERWEEGIYRHTSESFAESDDSFGGQLHMSFWHGNYYTNYERDYQSWLSASNGASVFFEEASGILYFGSPLIGLYCYIPAKFRYNRLKAVTTHIGRNSAPHLGESSLVTKIVPTPGIYADGYRYFTDDELPYPIDVTRLQQRLVLARGRTVYFSDINFPANYIGDNWFSIPSRGEITAIKEHYGSLLIFTEDETYHYRPAIGTLASGGQLEKLSNSVGCIDSKAVTDMEEYVAWVDKNGVYVTPGNLKIDYLSVKVEPFFHDFMTDPLHSFFVESGFSAQGAADEPNSVLQFKRDGCHIEWQPQMKALFITVPEENVTLVFSRGEWAVWSYETSAYTSGAPAAPHVGITRNIENPWMVASQENLYLVGSTDEIYYEDTLLYAGNVGTPANRHQYSNGYYIMEYGRGGAVDRSIEEEDYRTLCGWYNHRAPTVNQGRVIFDKWIQIPPGTVLNASFAVGTNDQVFWVPIVIEPPYDPPGVAGGVESGTDIFQLTFTFDNTNWTPVFRDAVSAELEALFPAERLISAPLGYAVGAPVNNVKEIQCWNGAVGPDRTGETIHVFFDGRLGSGTAQNWTYAPYMNLTTGRTNRMLYLPFHYTGSAYVSGLGINATTGVTCIIRDLTGAIGPITCLPSIWCQGTIPYDYDHYRDRTAQPVQWAYKSNPVSVENEGRRIMSRGAYVRMKSRGSGSLANLILPNWLYGVFNVLFGVDGKEWVTQVVDSTSLAVQSPNTAESAIRTRVLNAAGTALAEKVFGNAANTYGSIASAADGTYLIDDEEIDTFAVSLSGKGFKFSFMLFGFMQDRAQYLALESAVADIRFYGGRRRRIAH